jgi:peptide/nickel transport system permease protein
MLTFTLRRLAFAVPTVLVISLIVFLMLDWRPAIRRPACR